MLGCPWGIDWNCWIFVDCYCWDLMTGCPALTLRNVTREDM